MAAAEENVPIPLLGYADKLSGRAGDVISFKVSSTSSAPFNARLVRIICADPNPAGPGMLEEEVKADFAGSFPSREQPFFPGSYIIVDSPAPLNPKSDLVLTARVFPTLPMAGKPQVVLACGNVWLGLDRLGRLCASAAGQLVCTAASLRKRRWYEISMTASPAAGTLSVAFEELPALPFGRTLPSECPPGLARSSYQGSVSGLMGFEQPVYPTIAARIEDKLATDHFNGKIEAPKIWQSNSPVAAWDFGKGMNSTKVHDTGQHGLHGRIINLPTRGVPSSRWNGDEMRHWHKPEDFAAIHFHDDDIYDFGWETSFTYAIPDDLASGIYAARLSSSDGTASDAIPFFVCAPKGERRADLCVLMSTFTWVIYGNHARPDYKPEWHDTVRKWQAYPYNPAVHRQYGLSTYNCHSDGSGICYASHKRPLLNFRPGYRTFGYGGCSGLRHFPADTHLIAWLHHKGIAYDVVTDQELHDEGAAALEGYRCVTTGSHPEYHTARMLDALLWYRDHGGKLSYLGGNGFYWRVAVHSEESLRGTIEIRRGEGGIRAWAAETGEYYQSFDGEYGGLWRRNARAPQALVGVGFSTQGQFQGTYFRLKVDRSDPEVGWMLDGIEGDMLGAFGFSGGGAAGFELDRVDARLGTPENVRVIASSEKHPSTFVLVPEEVLTHLTTESGEDPAAMIRADMVYFELPGGGAVFSTGSITFCGSLPWNSFDNDVSRLLHNVFSRFLSS